MAGFKSPPLITRNCCCLSTAECTLLNSVAWYRNLSIWNLSSTFIKLVKAFFINYVVLPQRGMQLGAFSLEVSCTMYKIINGNFHIPSNSLIPPIIVTQEMDILRNYNAEQTLVNFLFSSSIKLWNSLPLYN